MATESRATVAALPTTCAVYGRGTFGRSLVTTLQRRGVTVAVLVDHIRGPEANGLPVSPLEALSGYPGCPVLLGICNPHANLAKIARDLDRFGAREIWSPARVFAALGAAGESLSHYWLTTDLALYERASSAIERARGLFVDERSRCMYDALLAYRISGEIDALPVADPPALQYQPADIPFIDGPVDLLDAGAYQGELMDAYLDAAVDVASIVAFEPDPANYSELVARLATHAGVRAFALPMAVAGSTALVRFSADGTTASALDPVGDTVLQCVRIDDLLWNWPITHVKMDIEGAEAEALEGMTALLAQWRPRLAVCAYHRPEDLWTLPLQIAALDLGYRFYLRTYGEQTFDSVVYALPT